MRDRRRERALSDEARKPAAAAPAQALRAQADRPSANGVVRKAFRMSVLPGRAGEYARRHQPIWPELEQILISHGVTTYSIYLDEASNDLFAYVEFTDERLWRAVAATEVCQRWWRSMGEVMPANPDNSPVSRELREVFHIDKGGSRRTAGRAKR